MEVTGENIDDQSDAIPISLSTLSADCATEANRQARRSYDAFADLDIRARSDGNLSKEDRGEIKKRSFRDHFGKAGEGVKEHMGKAGDGFRKIFDRIRSMPVRGSQHQAEGLWPSDSDTPFSGKEKTVARMTSSVVELQKNMDSAMKLQELLHRRASAFPVNPGYQVEIDTGKIPLELQEEFARVLGEPLFGEQGRVMSAEAAEPTIGGTSMDGMLRNVPRLTICILIVGTRGDVQPFIAIGKKLKEFGHRVRLASHANYREFIMGEGLEFFPLGGDPKLLAEYMVKNKGLLPSGPSEVHLQRKQLKAIVKLCWPACTEADVDSGGAPFIADAIIANPPTMAHITVAEALRVPLHVFFTMPWTPTAEFPSPLASVVTNKGFENMLSYYVVDNLMWLGMKDLINNLRRKLKLKQIRAYHVPHYAIPYGYIWSPSLAPKPNDWGKLEDVVGFCFLDLASDYEPPQDLMEFLEAGDPPVFVGFGSLPVGDPKRLTQVIIEAFKKTEQRGIIQKGWGGLGEVTDPPPNVYILGNCPHDWLFPRCKAVIHHGGAGTTAAGLKAGCPTTIVPFFGDQFFWGTKVSKAGVGPDPLPMASFTLEGLVQRINFMMHPEVQKSARVLSQRMAEEDGVQGAVDAFHKHLPEGFEARKKAIPWLLPTTNIARAGFNNIVHCCY